MSDSPSFFAPPPPPGKDPAARADGDSAGAAIRPEEVERGQQLAADARYPSRAILRRVGARLVASVIVRPDR